MPSFEAIDYRLRPAKQTERRMIADTLSLLLRLGPMDRYRYIGMGSISFLDFTLVHRALGIHDMVSMERPDNIDRVRFNAPFKCIEVIEGDSHTVLPKLDYKKPTIAWLDYDGKITADILGDIEYLAGRLIPGSMLFVTLNCHVSKRVPRPDELKRAAEHLEKAIGRKRFPGAFKPADLAGWKYVEFLQFVCSQEIQKAIVARNSLPKGSQIPAPAVDQRVDLKQIVNFGYSDGASMCTLGWFVDYQSDVRSLFQTVGFANLQFYRDKMQPFVIRPPILTPREVRHLNAQIPEAGKKAACPGITAAEIAQYVEVYRHFPSYFEVAEV